MAAAPSSVSLPGEGAAADNISGRPVWLRNYRLLLGGSVLSQLGTLGAAAANPLLALALTGSPIVAGWVAAANTLPGLVLHLPAGLLADRYDRRWIMAISQGVRLINSVILIYCLVFLPAPWAIFVVAAVVDGSCAVFFRIAELAAVRHVVPDGEAENRMGKSEARHHLALVLGRPVGGLLFTWGRSFPYLLDALTTCISLISIACLKGNLKSDPPLRGASRASRRKALSSLREGLNHIFRDRLLFVSFGACAVANAGFQIVILLLVVEAERQGFTGTIIGAMLATSGLSGFLGAITAPMVVRRFLPVVTIKGCVLLWFPLILVVAIADDARVGLGAWGVCSFMGAYINVALAVHQSKVIPRGALGRVEGITQFLTTGAVALGASAGGYVISCFGSRTTAVLMAVAFLAVAVVVCCLAHPRGRTLEARTGFWERPVAAARAIAVVTAWAAAGVVARVVAVVKKRIAALVKTCAIAAGIAWAIAVVMAWAAVVVVVLVVAVLKERIAAVVKAWTDAVADTRTDAATMIGARDGGAIEAPSDTAVDAVAEAWNGAVVEAPDDAASGDPVPVGGAAPVGANA